MLSTAKSNSSEGNKMAKPLVLRIMEVLKQSNAYFSTGKLLSNACIWCLVVETLKEFCNCYAKLKKILCKRMPIEAFQE
jgi:hypothetical protein